MSTITIDDDLARIDAIKHHHLMHHDPGGEHWRDIDALLHACSRHDAELGNLDRARNDDLEAAFREHRHELEDLRADHKSELDDRDREIRDLEKQVAERDGELLDDFGQKAVLTDTIERLTRRCDWLVEVARLFASRVSPEHRAMLDKKLATLKSCRVPEAQLTQPETVA